MENRRKLLEDFRDEAKAIIGFLHDIGDDGIDNWWWEMAAKTHHLESLYRKLWRPDGIDPPEVPPLVIHFFTNLREMDPKPSYVDMDFPNDKNFWLLFMQHPDGIPKLRWKTLARDQWRMPLAEDRRLRKSISFCLKTWVAFAENDIAQPQGPKTSSEADPASSPRVPAADRKVLIVAHLHTHHEVSEQGIMNSTPVSVNGTAETLGISTGALSEWFKGHFGSHSEYQNACHRNPSTIAAKLRTLHGDKTLSREHYSGASPDEAEGFNSSTGNDDSLDFASYGGDDED